MKKYGYFERISILFFIGMIIGLISACFLREYYVENYKAYFAQVNQKLLEGNLHYGLLFFETAKRALLPFLFLTAASFTAFAYPCCLAYTVYMGYYIGYFLSSVTFTFHIKGFFYGILYGMPQMLLYAPVMAGILCYVCRQKKEGETKKGFKEMLIPALMVATLLLAGAFLETFVNSWIMKKVVFLVQ